MARFSPSMWKRWWMLERRGVYKDAGGKLEIISPKRLRSRKYAAIKAKAGEFWNNPIKLFEIGGNKIPGITITVGKTTYALLLSPKENAKLEAARKAHTFEEKVLPPKIFKKLERARKKAEKLDKKVAQQRGAQQKKGAPPGAIGSGQQRGRSQPPQGSPQQKRGTPPTKGTQQKKKS
ncbi:MAG: hypothetical protein V1494_02560 [Candidatus Diapherotrites archaeon]